MRRDKGIFHPEDLKTIEDVCEQVCFERRYRIDGLAGERLALRAMTLFDNGYTNEASLIRALRQDA